jgi:hypothetical protein
MAKLRLLAVLVACAFLYLPISCGRGTGNLSSETRAAAQKALTSLRMVDNAMELNLSREELRRLIVQTRAEVDQTLTRLPEGELKNEMNLALEAYITRLRAMDEIDRHTENLRFASQLLRGKPMENDPPQFVLYKNEKDNAALIELLKKKYATKFQDGMGYEANARGNSPPTLPYTSFDGDEVLASTLKAGRTHTNRASELLKD